MKSVRLRLYQCAAIFVAALIAVLSACASEPKVVSPHVLFIVVDDLHADLPGFGSSQIETPGIRRIANRGIRFTRAYAQYPQCNQSRASLLTGLYPEQVGVLDLKSFVRDRLPEITTLPQHFRDSGYFAARVGKIFHQGVPGDIGRDGMDDPVSWNLAVNPRGLDADLDTEVQSIAPVGEKRPGLGGLLSWLATPGDGSELTDAKVADAALAIAEKHAGDQPLFLAVGFYRPHTPFVAPTEFFDRYPIESIQLIPVSDGDRNNKPPAALADRPFQLGMSDQQKREATQAYYASVSFVDAQVGRLLDGFEKLGILDNTIVVFLSDHGYQLGHHGLWQKGDLFENSARVPLIIAAPQMSERSVANDAVVELVDIFPTLVSMAGLKPPSHTLNGKDISDISHTQPGDNRTALTQAWSRAGWTRPEFRGRDIMGYSIRTDRYRYTEWSGGSEGVELYDYEVDPAELRNVAQSVDYAPVLLEMQIALEQSLQRSQDRQ